MSERVRRAENGGGRARPGLSDGELEGSRVGWRIVWAIK